MKRALSKEIIRQNQTRLITVTADYPRRRHYGFCALNSPRGGWGDVEMDGERERKTREKERIGGREREREKEKKKGDLERERE